MATDKIQVGLRLEYNEWRKITYIAKQNKRSLNSQVEYLVKSHIDRYEAEHGPIRIDEPDKQPLQSRN